MKDEVKSEGESGARLTLKLDQNETNEESLSQQYISCHRSYVILGDLARYHRDLVSDPAQKNWTKVRATAPSPFILTPLLLHLFILLTFSTGSRVLPVGHQALARKWTSVQPNGSLMRIQRRRIPHALLLL